VAALTLETGAIHGDPCRLHNSLNETVSATLRRTSSSVVVVPPADEVADHEADWEILPSVPAPTRRGTIRGSIRGVAFFDCARRDVRLYLGDVERRMMAAVTRAR
jgi:hypothetical protein